MASSPLRGGPALAGEHTWNVEGVAAAPGACPAAVKTPPHSGGEVIRAPGSSWWRPQGEPRFYKQGLSL